MVRKPILPNNVLRRWVFPACATLNLPNATWLSGLDSFRDPPVVTFSSRQGLGKDQAAGIQASRDGTVWVANSFSLDRIRNGMVTSIARGKAFRAPK